MFSFACRQHSATSPLNPLPNPNRKHVYMQIRPMIIENIPRLSLLRSVSLSRGFYYLFSYALILLIRLFVYSVNSLFLLPIIFHLWMDVSLNFKHNKAYVSSVKRIAIVEIFLQFAWNNIQVGSFPRNKLFWIAETFFNHQPQTGTDW